MGGREGGTGRYIRTSDSSPASRGVLSEILRGNQKQIPSGKIMSLQQSIVSVMNEFEIRTRVKFLNESRKREPARCRAASDTELVTGSGAPGARDARSSLQGRGWDADGSPGGYGCD